MGQEKPLGHDLNNCGSTRDATKVSRPLPDWFWRIRVLKGFSHIWAWRPCWSCDQDLDTFFVPKDPGGCI